MQPTEAPQSSNMPRSPGRSTGSPGTSRTRAPSPKSTTTYPMLERFLSSRALKYTRKTSPSTCSGIGFAAWERAQSSSPDGWKTLPSFRQPIRSALPAFFSAAPGLLLGRPADERVQPLVDAHAARARGRDGHLARLGRDALQPPVVARPQRPPAPALVRQVEVDGGRAVADLEVYEVEAAAEHPAHGDVARVLGEARERHLVLVERVVRDDDLAELRPLQPRRERLVAEDDVAALLHDARHLRHRLLRLAEVVEPAEVENGVEEAVGERQKAG